jgi:hypothetical protein
VSCLRAETPASVEGAASGVRAPRVGRCSDSSKGEASTGSSRPLESAALVEKQEPGRVLPLARPQGGLWFGRGHPRAFPTDVEAGARGITGAIGRNSEAGAIGRNSEACPELAASSLGLDDWAAMR